jgi:hypothetical protein
MIMNATFPKLIRTKNMKEDIFPHFLRGRHFKLSCEVRFRQFLRLRFFVSVYKINVLNTLRLLQKSSSVHPITNELFTEELLIIYLQNSSAKRQEK